MSNAVAVAIVKDTKALRHVPDMHMLLLLYAEVMVARVNALRMYIVLLGVSLQVNTLCLQSGLIVNVGSIAALSPMPKTAVYATSKWGLRGWSLSCYEVQTHPC